MPQVVSKLIQVETVLRVIKGMTVMQIVTICYCYERIK